MIRRDYTPLDEMEKPFTNAAEDRGKARAIRDYLIGEAKNGVDLVNAIKAETDIGVGRSRMARIIDTHDWFVETEIAGDPAIQITQAGHVALRDDDNREYEAIAGHRFAEETSGVSARAD